jgi:mono/diheme cytochrome c family protein
MNKRPIVIFLIFAAICLVALPAWALTKRGSSDASNGSSVPASDRVGMQLFQTNCGSCHTMQAAGTDGMIGPNLDQLLATGSKTAQTVKSNRDRVLSAVEGGLNGRMPKGILQGAQAKQVAQFVANNVAYLSSSPTNTTPTP